MGGADKDLNNREFPSLVIQKMLDYDIANTNPRYFRGEVYNNINVVDGVPEKILLERPPIPIVVQSAVEIWTIDPFEDINFTASFLSLIRGRRFDITVPFEGTDYVVHNEVSKGIDLSSQGTSGIRQDRVNSTKQDKRFFRKVWTLESELLLINKRDEFPPVTGDVVTDYEQNVDLFDGNPNEIDTENDGSYN